MPTGWMEDSRHTENAAEGAIFSGVTYRLESHEGHQTLVVSLDRKWLVDPQRVYPVKVDPWVTGVKATSGTYVESPYNTNVVLRPGLGEHPPRQGRWPRRRGLTIAPHPTVLRLADLVGELTLTSRSSPRGGTTVASCAVPHRAKRDHRPIAGEPHFSYESFQVPATPSRRCATAPSILSPRRPVNRVRPHAQ